MRLLDMTVPRTQAARAATELAVSCHSAALINHLIRSWLWATAFALLEDRQGVDHELLYTSALLHDIGLVPDYDNASLSYEEAGALMRGITPEARAVDSHYLVVFLATVGFVVSKIWPPRSTARICCRLSRVASF